MIRNARITYDIDVPRAVHGYGLGKAEPAGRAGVVGLPEDVAIGVKLCRAQCKIGYMCLAQGVERQNAAAGGVSPKLAPLAVIFHRSRTGDISVAHAVHR